jgi:hypothetical protein
VFVFWKLFQSNSLFEEAIVSTIFSVVKHSSLFSLNDEEKKFNDIDIYNQCYKTVFVTDAKAK